MMSYKQKHEHALELAIGNGTTRIHFTVLRFGWQTQAQKLNAPRRLTRLGPFRRYITLCAI
jgi:hypothetical protein